MRVAAGTAGHQFVSGSRLATCWRLGLLDFFFDLGAEQGFEATARGPWVLVTMSTNS